MCVHPRFRYHISYESTQRGLEPARQAPHIKRCIQLPSQGGGRSLLRARRQKLIGSGMDTLDGKLADVGKDKIVGRVVELWGFFWDQVLPYVEGVRLLSCY